MIDSLDATERTPYIWDATERVPRMVLSHRVSHVLEVEPKTTPFVKARAPVRRRTQPPPIPAVALRRLPHPPSPPSSAGTFLGPRPAAVTTTVQGPPRWRQETVEATRFDDGASSASGPIERPSWEALSWREPALWGVAVGSFVLGVALTLLATRNPSALAPSHELRSSVAAPTAAEPTPPSR